MADPDGTTVLPDAYRTGRLERNLAVLDRTQPDLAARVRLPVGGDHVEFPPEHRGPCYRRNRSLFQLDLDDPAAAPGMAEALALEEGHVLLLGLGSGDLLDRLTVSLPEAVRVTAWDADPWLLRLELLRRNRTGFLRSGRLRYALGTDLLRLSGEADVVVEHPLLRRFYRREIAAFHDGAGERRALLCDGGLFVDQLGDALEREGYRVWMLQAKRFAPEEIDLTVRRFDPELVAAINYTNGLAELCTRHGRKLLCWEIDPSTSVPAIRGEGHDGVHVFTWRKRNVDVYREAGFPNVSHVSLAADPYVRAPTELTEAERGKYAAPISFVGASMVENVEDFRRRFGVLWARWTGDPAEDAARVLNDVVGAQRKDFTRFRIPELLEEHAPGMRSSFAGDPTVDDPVYLLGEIAASEKRLTYVANLGALGVHVWGDAGWKLIERHGAVYRGLAVHGEELTKIYNASTINVDVGRIYQSDIVTMRTFDILACGAFLLAEHTPDLDELFEVGVEVETYRTLGELKEKAVHYAAHPEQARAIALRGQATVLERHTIAQRLHGMLASVYASGGGSSPG